MESGWKIDRRKRACTGCSREFASEEKHYSAIRRDGAAFGRLDACTACWDRLFPAGTEPPFSFWKTVAPRREKKRLEDVAAMTEFFKKLLERAGTDPGLEKVTYLTALLLMRKRRVRAAGSRSRDGRAWLVLEKSWDGEAVEIVDPPIADDELAPLKAQLEALFDLETPGAAAPEPAPPATA